MARKEELLGAMALVIVALLATSLPYLLGYALAPSLKEFAGVVMNFEDAHSYLAKMRQGADGQLLYQIPFTSEEHPPAFIGTFYFFWGWLARVTGWPLLAWWHIGRLLCDALLLLVIYLFISYFLAEPRPRLFAFGLTTFGAGLGWLELFLGAKFIPDFQMPELHPFFTLVTFPHFSFAAAMLLATLLLILRYIDTGRGVQAWAAGLTGLLLTVSLPYLALTLFLTTSLYLGSLFLRRFIELRRIVNIWPVFFLPAIPLVYYLVVIASNPIFHAWWQQAETPSPPIWDYGWALGPILLLALPGLHRAWGERNSSLLVVWTVGIIPLLYLPLNPERRLSQGAHIAWSILAAMGTTHYLLPWLERSWFAKLIAFRPQRYRLGSLRTFTLFALVLLSIPSNLYILGSLGASMIQGQFPFFREREEIAAVDWLGNNTDHQAVVLASYFTGYYIPARAGNRVFIGHWAETKDFAKKLGEVDRFFKEETGDRERIEFLSEYSIDYLFFGPRERELGGFDPHNLPYLAPVFSNDLVAVFEVKISSRSSSGVFSKMGVVWDRR